MNNLLITRACGPVDDSKHFQSPHDEIRFFIVTVTDPLQVAKY
jgi:hypothetical protein